MIDPRFALVGAVLSMMGSSWYAVLTLRGVVRPNRVTWFLWAAAPGIAFGAQVGDGVGLPAVTTLAVGLGPFLILCASFANRSSYWRVSGFDLSCGVVAAVALLAWLALDDPVLAVLTALAADAIGGVPTVVKAWRHPDTERPGVYLLATANGTLALLSLSAYDATTVAFPCYLILLGLTMCSIVTLRGRRVAAAQHTPSPTNGSADAHPSSRPLADVDQHTLYRIMALRVAVFVHEQRIVDEIELDGADLLATTQLFWVEDDDGEVAATLRVLVDDAVHIGRVATAATARGRGHAGRLIEAALQAYPGPVEISAQAHLEAWYGGFGFARTGDNYLDAGIPHVRMEYAPR